MSDYISTIINTQDNILIHGPGGTGKSTLIKKIYDFYDKNECAKTAMTGMAALQIGGITLHRFMGIGLAVGSPAACFKKVERNRKICKVLKNVKILIIDEISMFGKELAEKIDYVLKRIRNNKKVFGGLRVIFSGDFFQLPPVKDDWIFEWKGWKEFKFLTINLTTPWRFSNDNSWHEMLLNIRVGNITPEIDTALRNCLTKDLTGDIHPTILYSTNRDVSSYNKNKLEYIKEPTFIYNCEDYIKKTPPSETPNVILGKRTLTSDEEEIYSTQLNSSIPSIIELKKGAQVMLRYNIDSDAGLVNGSRGVVLECEKNCVKVEFKNNTVYTVSTVNWEIIDEEITIVRSQIPLILAYSITCHKSQGLTIDSVVMSFASIFSHGQAYVALSRVRNIKDLFLLDYFPSKITADEKVLKMFQD